MKAEKQPPTNEQYISWLVVDLAPLKNMSSSIGSMKFPIYGKIKFMFQTTNQLVMCTGWWCNVAPSWKNDGVKVHGKDGHPIYDGEKKIMFETTNQICYVYVIICA